MQKQATGKMSVREAGRRGGEAVKAKYGQEFYEAIGRIGGKKGGEAVKQKYGSDYYKAIGRKGGQRVKQVIAETKQTRGGNHDAEG